MAARAHRLAPCICLALAGCGTLLDLEPAEPDVADAGASMAEAASVDASDDLMVGDTAVVDGPRARQRPIAFVTSDTFGTSIGGRTGANQLCQAAAAAASLPGSYVAYLETSTATAESALPMSPTRWFDVDGRLLFNAWPPADNLEPWRTESGALLPIDAEAWTGKLSTCGDWSGLDAMSCGFGKPSTSGGMAWRRTGSSSQTGGTPRHLYCFGD